MDQREVEALPEVVVATGEPLTAPASLVGSVDVVFPVSTEDESIDCAVVLRDVAPDGTFLNITEGIIRLSDAQLAGEITVALLPTAHTFLPGHRIRVDIAGAHFPTFARNEKTFTFTVTGPIEIRTREL
ncbi:CocE/NonD family hydrolase [Corynebacterium epidermidicanis]|nr:CocE/NonD family hydrolase [Corynebacterium epidermidicanis]